MSRFVALVADVALVVLATLAAFVLCANFEVSLGRLSDFLAYTGATAMAAFAVFPAAGLNRAPWCDFALPGCWRVSAAAVATVCAAAAIGFAYNRLDGLPRSLPILQLLAGLVILSGARALYRFGHASRGGRRAPATLLELDRGPRALTVVIVGISKLTGAYLQAAAELAPQRIRIAGLVGHSSPHAGPLAASYPVLGVPEDIEHILNALEAHGIHADRIVVTIQFEALSSEAREALLRAARSRNIPLHFLAEDLGFKEPDSSTANGCDLAAPRKLGFDVPPAGLALPAARRYSRAGRVFDAAAASVLIAASAPLLLFTGACVALSMGFPIVCWQERAGTGGKLFRLYRFRTAHAAVSPDGRCIADGERMSIAGSLLRRLRLDGLPQLFNILRGDMSFAGPWPLPAREQPGARQTRSPERQGLTSREQTAGGGDVSCEDKASPGSWPVRKGCTLTASKGTAI